MANNTRPLVLVDLDDTLFQTQRKMNSAAAAVAGLDKQGQPLSFMTQIQSSFVDWLFSHADVVPVTARSLDAVQRVLLPFSGPVICNHGAHILNAERQIDGHWQQQMQQRLVPLAPVLRQLHQQVQQLAADLGLRLRTWLTEDAGLPLYVLIKHNMQHDACLEPLAERIRAELLPAGFYLHLNANNLAILPLCLNKREAVQEVLRRDREVKGERPILGFGDSLSDFSFLSCCHWWASPQQGQLSQWLKSQLIAAGHLDA